MAGFPAPVLLGSEILYFGASGANASGDPVFPEPSRSDRIAVRIRTLGFAK
jgi:hypothetical protein